MLRDGMPVEYKRGDGGIAGDFVQLVDFEDVTANDWLAVNSSPLSKARITAGRT